MAIRNVYLLYVPQFPPMHIWPEPHVFPLQVQAPELQTSPVAPFMLQGLGSQGSSINKKTITIIKIILISKIILKRISNNYLLYTMNMPKSRGIYVISDCKNYKADDLLVNDKFSNITVEAEFAFQGIQYTVDISDLLLSVN